ncbi:MAG TPA: hypothetical protein VF341_07015 [Anaeromyxobacteraceae bacterium]
MEQHLTLLPPEERVLGQDPLAALELARPDGRRLSRGEARQEDVRVVADRELGRRQPAAGILERGAVRDEAVVRQERAQFEASVEERLPAGVTFIGGGTPTRLGFIGRRTGGYPPA